MAKKGQGKSNGKRGQVLTQLIHYDMHRNEDNEEEEGQQVAAGGKNKGEGEDLINYKGIYYNDDSGQKYTDPQNGAHFEFKDMCARITKLMIKR